MTLRDKLIKLDKDNDFQNRDEACDAIESLLVEFADEQSIGFADWKDENNIKRGTVEKLRSLYYLEGKHYTQTELLNIYKQQL